jgi:PIN like domain
LSHVFFTDRDLGKRFPEILSEAGLSVERHGDHFGPAATDEEWLETVGQEGWIAITHDARIRYKPNELAAVVKHRVPLLVVVGKAPFPDLARSFVMTMPRIEAFLARHAAPFIAKVYRGSTPDAPDPSPGRIELWYPKQHAFERMLIRSFL